MAIANKYLDFRDVKFGLGTGKKWGTWWRNSLRHCATRLKVVDSIPDGAVGYEYQEYFLGGKGDRCVGLTLTPSSIDCMVIWKPQTLGTPRACPGQYRECFTFYR